MDWFIFLVLGTALISAIPGRACFEPGFVYLYSYTGEIEVGKASTGAFRIEGTLSVEAVGARHLTFQIDAKCLDNTLVDTSQLGIKFHVELDGAGSVLSLWYPNGTRVTHWASNYHKALASLFNVRYPTDGAATTYSIMQDEVTGKCENVYDWSPKPALNCTGYQMYKTRNFDRCQEVPMYNAIAPAGWRCRPMAAACEGVQSRSLVQTADVCRRQPAGPFHIVYLESREDWLSLPWGVMKRRPYDRVHIVQRLRLTSQRGRTGPPPSREPVGITPRSSLIFTAGRTEFDGPDDERAADWLLNNITEMRRIVFETPELVRRRASIVRRELLARFRSLDPAALRFVTEKAYRHLGPLEWSMYVQHVAAIGSGDALDAVKLLMEQGRISTGDATAIVSGFGMFVREPSDGVLAQLLSLLDVDMVKREARLRQTAMVSLASFFRTACIDRLAAETRFPLAWPPLSSVTSGRNTTSVWPQRLVERLAVELKAGNWADRSAVLSAFNIIGHPSVIPVVIPIIEGKIDANPLVRTKAVLALHKLAHHGNKDAIKILHTVFANPSENYQVRMGAFTLLMLSNPPDHVWQSVAARTWFEPRIQVASFVYTTLETLASFRSPIAFLQKLSQQAKKVVPLTKPISRRRSANFIWSYEQKRRLLASYVRLETFANKASDIPKEIYGRLNVNLGAIDFDLLEFEMHAHHLEALLDEVMLAGHDDGRREKQCRRAASSPVDALLIDELNVAYHADGPSEGYIRWTLMESFEDFWSFNVKDARRLAAAMDSGALIGDKIQWYAEWPIVNVELRWPNSMGFLNEVIVTGRISGTLNGSVRAASRQPLVLDTQLRPTLALSIESEYGVQMGRSTLSSNSSILSLASLPGRSRVQLDRDALKLHWSTDDVVDSDKEMIFFHKSECADGSCPQAASRVGGGVVQQQSFDEILSALSFAWLPAAGSIPSTRHWSLERPSFHSLQLTLHFDVDETPIGWIMKSGKLLRSTRRRPDGAAREPLSEFSKPMIGRAPAMPHQFEFPAQMALALTKALIKTQQDRGRIEIEWTSPEKNASCAFVQSTAAPSLGECRISSLTVDTFDGLVYEPQMRDGCQYVAAAATGRDDKFAVLLDRQSRNRNEALRIIVTRDVIVANVAEKTLTVNNIEIPLDSGGEGFLLVHECFGKLLLARKIGTNPRDERLVIELPFHGLVLEIEDDIVIKAMASLRGRLQGLCGDMNGETLFEFRGPGRCVLASGELMAGQYATSSQCRHLPPAAPDAGCPRQEGAPTVIHLFK